MKEYVIFENKDKNEQGMTSLEQWNDLKYATVIRLDTEGKPNFIKKQFFAKTDDDARETYYRWQKNEWHT